MFALKKKFHLFVIQISKLKKLEANRVNHVMFHHYVSKIFPSIESATTLKNFNERQIYDKLLITGIVASESQGLFSLLPLGLRSINKINILLDQQMNKIEAQKILLPHLINSSLWKKSNRYENCGQEIFRIRDKHNKEYIIGPTHEEAITNLVASYTGILTFKTLPLRLYQISTKFRDEPNPKHGLLRGREFLMKDLYTFDESKEKALETYEKVSHVYKELFSKLKLPIYVADAQVGDIGGIISHEYQVLSENGEDKILICENCNNSKNIEMIINEDQQKCSSCGEIMKEKKGIEVGHTFHLGTRYSKPLSAFFKDATNKNVLLNMGCYGIGVSRLLVTALEYHSKKNDQYLLWPPCIAPYKICIIGAKRKSKAADVSFKWCYELYQIITEIPGFSSEVLIDDRTKNTIGKRQVDIKRLGIPLVIVLGKKIIADMPMIELIDNFNEKNYEFTQQELLNFLKSYQF